MNKTRERFDPTQTSREGESYSTNNHAIKSEVCPSHLLMMNTASS